jgi:hypothetical protein
MKSEDSSPPEPVPRRWPIQLSDISESDSAKKRKNDWRWVFLEDLEMWGSYNHAALAAGVSYRTVLKHREKFPRFRDRCEEAIEKSTQWLEMEARRRIFQGVKDPASATLLIFMLKSLRPDVYRDIPPPKKLEGMLSGEEIVAIFQKVMDSEQMVAALKEVQSLIARKEGK